MGLDTVELLMNIEKYFHIRIPDMEAEKILTVQNMVDSVASHLGVTSPETPLRDKIFSDIVLALKQVRGIKEPIKMTDYMAGYIATDDKGSWNELENLLKLKLPKVRQYKPESRKFSDQFMRLISGKGNYDWQLITAAQFTDAVCARNYDLLLDRNNIRNKYEIYTGVSGITVDKTGIDYLEVLPEKSFNNDFGIE